MPSYTQSNRLIGITTPLGPDVLLLRSMTAREGLSTLFELQLDLLSTNHQISAEQILGQSVTVRLELQDGRGTRYFNGLVCRFEHAGAPVTLADYGPFSSYRATVVPWLWFLTRTSDCRIFQGKTVPEIIMQIFRDAGFTDFADRTRASYRTWEYCVQYRETDFNFVARLMEEEGIYYFFKSLSTIVRSGQYAHKAFDFEKPRTDLSTVAGVPHSHPQADHEIYDYPGGYLETGIGDDYARVRIEEAQADYETVDGAGYASGLSAGYLFSLTDHPRPDQNREYLIVSAVHQLASDEFETAGSTPGPVYRGSFVAMDSHSPFRAPRSTPKPVVQGPQTAIVVGKQGEEIWTDKYGRIKVKFHWDRERERNENSSCWIRVASPWAGNNWGAIDITRVGQEVVVQFL
ncbi:MAG: type VI secretion system tip protein TssI/VgrG [Chromatiaceae bacterium]